jgi:hypothetical protein
MPKTFDVRSAVSQFRARASKDPRLVARSVLGTLLFLNLIAAYAVFYPVGGSAEDLERQIASLQQQMQQRQAVLAQTRTLVVKIEQARTTGDEFLGRYFLDRQTTYSTILGQLDLAAKEAGMRPKERSIGNDPIEGTDVLSMMTVTANYEGNYTNLLQFVNRLDKSPVFLILDTMMATPQQGSSTLNVQVKFNTFVRESAI